MYYSVRHSYSQKNLCIAENRETNEAHKDNEFEKPNEKLFKVIRKPFISTLILKGKSEYTTELSPTYKSSTQVSLLIH